MIEFKRLNIIDFQAGKEDNTDAEIERIKAEIETEQKSKETIGETTDRKLTNKIFFFYLFILRMDKRRAGEDSEDDGEERDRDGVGEPRDRRLGRQAEVRGAEAAQHPADGAEAVAGARAGGDQAQDPE